MIALLIASFMEVLLSQKCTKAALAWKKKMLEGDESGTLNTAHRFEQK